MIRDICKDETFLAQKAEPATPDDLSVAADLLETLAHHKDRCVGMAANMIGVRRRIIIFDDNGTLIPELQALAPKGQRRMGANPHANGGLLLRELRRTNPDIEKSIFHSIHSVCLDTMVGYKSGGVEHTFADCYRERGEMAEMEKEDAE